MPCSRASLQALKLPPQSPRKGPWRHGIPMERLRVITVTNPLYQHGNIIIAHLEQLVAVAAQALPVGNVTSPLRLLLHLIGMHKGIARLNLRRIPVTAV